MPDYTTPYYSLVKPEIDGSPETWGQKLNADWDILDTNLKRVDDRAFACLPKDGSEEATAMLKYTSTQTPPVNEQDIPNKKYVDDAIKLALISLFPIGSVIMWTGDPAAIPLGWGLCNGELQEGMIKPNMLNRFVIGGGPGSSYAVKATGGANTHSHADYTGYTAIDATQMPYHNHVATDQGHRHTYDRYTSTPPDTQAVYQTANQQRNNATNNTSYAAAPIVVGYVGGNVGHRHTIAVDNNIPLYYAVCFIVRVK